MIYLDIVNGLFEGVGGYFTWKNAYCLYRDKYIKGVYWPATLFFSVWGIWNLHYYPNLQQYYSFLAGVFVTSGNVAWVLLLWYYSRRKRNDQIGS